MRTQRARRGLRWPTTLVVLPLAFGFLTIALLGVLDALIAGDFAGRDDLVGWLPVLAMLAALFATAALLARRRGATTGRALATGALALAALAAWTILFLLAWLVIVVASCVSDGSNCW